MNKNKIRKLFVLAVMSGMLMTGLNNAAYAVVTDYAVKVNDQIYSYNEGNLKCSFLDYKRSKPAKLYEDFASKLKAGNGFYAFKDDKKGFISYKTLEKGLIEAKRDKKTFNIDKVIEKDDCKAVEINSVKEVKLNEKNEILIKDSDNTINKNDDNKAKKEEEVTGASITNTSKSSEGSSSRRSSRGSSSSKRKKEESKKVVPEVKRKEKKTEVSVVKPEIKKPEVEKTEPKKEETQKKPEAIQNKEEKKAEKLVVKPDIKKTEATNDMIPKITEGKMWDIKENEKPESVTSGEGIKLKSEITQLSQKNYPSINQETTVFIRGIVENDGVMEVAGQRIEVKKDDNYSTVTKKIYEYFKNNEDWQVEHKYIQAGYQGNLTFKSKKVRDHVDNLFASANGIEFFNIKNEAYGFKGIREKREVCTVTVLEDCKKNETINIKVSSDVVNKTFATLVVEIKSGESKNIVVERIVAQLKASEEIKRYFTVENIGENIVLTQKNIADKLNLKVTVEKKNHEKTNVQNDREKADSKVSSPVNKESEKVKEQQKEEERQAALKKQQDDEAETLRVQRENEAKKQAELQKQKEADERAKREKEREAKAQNKEVQIESKCIEKGSTVEFGTAQTGNLAFKFQGAAKNKLTKKQTTKILDKTIEFEAEDDSGKIKSKILNAFEGHKDWTFQVGYVVVEEAGASVQYTCERAQEDVYGEEFAKDTDEIKFIQSNVRSGYVGKPAVKEKLEIAVKKLSNKDATVDINLKLTKNNANLGSVQVKIGSQDGVEQVAQKIATALKGNKNISRLYKIEVQQAKVVLTQNQASKDETDITVKIS